MTEGRVASRPAAAGFTVATAAAVASAIVIAVAGLPARHEAPFTIPTPVLAIALFGSYALVLVFEGTRGSQEINLSEIPLLLGLVFAPPLSVLVAAGAALTAHHVGAVRQPVYRAWFNVGATFLSTVVAVEVYARILGTSSPASRVGWLAA